MLLALLPGYLWLPTHLNLHLALTERAMNWPPAMFSVLSALPWPLSSSKHDTDKDQHATKPKRADSAWLEPLLLRKHQHAVRLRNCRHNLLLLPSNDKQSRP